MDDPKNRLDYEIHTAELLLLSISLIDILLSC